MKANFFKVFILITFLGTFVSKTMAQQKLFAGRVNNASSVYDVYPFGWSTYQILGLPNVYPNYGDIPEAFNPENFGVQRDYIDLGFDNNGPIDSIFIYQTYTPGFIDSVFIKNPGTNAWDLVYSNIPSLGAPVATILEIGFPTTTFPVKEVRLTLANDTASDWIEIDAVAISPSTATPFIAETTPGTAYNFDGINDTYHTYSSLLNLITNTEATFTAWVNIHQATAPSVANAYDGAGVLCDADGTYIGIYLANLGGNDSLYFYNYDGTDDYFGMDYTLNTWFHIAMVHDGGQLKAYKNGILYRTIDSDTTGYIGTRALEMGFNLASGNYFEGEIDEVTTFNVGLTATEVNEVMRMNTIGVSGMTGYWQMSNCDEQHFYNPLNHIADSLEGVSCNFSGVPNFANIETNHLENQDFILFPNPSMGELLIQLKNIQAEYLIIYDVAGRIVYQSNTNGDHLISLNVSNLETGIYSVQIVDLNRKTYTKKLIKN